MMEAVQRLVVQATDRDQTKVMRPETMTDEDLEAMAMSYVQRLQPTRGSLPSNARPDPEPDEEMWVDGS